MSSQFWINCLKIASAIVIAFGLIVAAAAHPATAGLTIFFADILIWPFDGNPAAPDQVARLLSAIGGGVMAGWGVMLWLTVTKVMPHMPDIGRRLVLAGIISWFVIDSTGSLVAGVPLNVAGNLLFLVAFLVPLWALARQDNRTAAA